MRSAQKSNRARGRGNRKSAGSNINRVYESAGPEGKVRGTPQQIIDKYLTLARDAQTSGDRVTAENFLQHAEHYQRILLLATGGQNERREQPDTGADAVEPDEEAAAPSAAGNSRPSTTAADTDEPPAPAQNGAMEQPEAPALSVAESDAEDPVVVSGLTTIDTSENEPEGDLLVQTEEVARSQPRRRRANGRAKAPEAEPEEQHSAE